MITKPILKWVGGKTQILEVLLRKIKISLQDKPLENYYEIFLGGGSVLLAILSWVKNEEIRSKDLKINAYDSNRALIYTFINIRDYPQEIYDSIKPMIEYYHSVNEKDKEAYYYQIREHYNSLSDEHKESYVGSAIFIFLNKTGFRGLYREGPKGYNVPFGHYKNPEILNYEHLMEVSSLIKEVNFEVADFTKSIDFTKDIDLVNQNIEDSTSLVYLDPPYYPENETSFTRYNRNDFTLENHKILFELCHKIPIPFIMSNSNTQFVKDSFHNDKYSLESISCRRAINSKAPESRTNELIITKF
jgi:DNA adenine methylase